MGAKRELTEEQLKKLALAREKALEAKRKKALIRKADKEKEKKALDDRYNELVSNKHDITQEPINEPEIPKTPPPTQTRKPKKVIQIEVDSDETSSDSSSESDSESDTEYDITPIKQKYKQKYKNKYQTKYPKPYDPLADISTIARHNIKSKVSEELQKMAYASLFG